MLNSEKESGPVNANHKRDYALGYTESEFERLQSQGRFFRDLTEDLLRRAGCEFACRVEIWRGGTRMLRFQIPLIKPDVQISRIRLSDKVSDAVAHPERPRGAMVRLGIAVLPDRLSASWRLLGFRQSLALLVLRP